MRNITEWIERARQPIWRGCETKKRSFGVVWGRTRRKERMNPKVPSFRVAVGRARFSERIILHPESGRRLLPRRADHAKAKPLLRNRARHGSADATHPAPQSLDFGFPDTELRSPTLDPSSVLATTEAPQRLNLGNRNYAKRNGDNYCSNRYDGNPPRRYSFAPFASSSLRIGPSEY